MKVIQVEIKGWHAEVFTAAADARSIPAEELIRQILDDNACRRVDGAARVLLSTSWTADLEYRLADLFHR